MRTNTNFLVQSNRIVTLAGAGLLAALPLPAPAAAKTAVPGINKVTGLEISSDARGTHIVIEGSNAFTPEVRPMGKPSATVIMVPGQWSAGPSGLTNVRRNGVWTVRYGQYTDGAAASTVRIVANTRQTLPVTSRPSADRHRWEVTVWAPGVTPVNTPVSTAAAKPIAAKPATIKPTIPFVSPSFIAAANSAAASLKPHGEPIISTVSAMVLASETTPAALTSFAPTRSAGFTAKVSPAPPAPVALAAPIPAVSPRPYLTPGIRTGRIAGDAKMVSISFIDSDITDVLKALAIQSHINIVAGDNAKDKKITVTLTSVPMLEALDMVTRLSGLRYALIGSTYVVGSGANVAALTRGASVAQAISSAIPFTFSDGDTLQKSVESAFPNVNASLVRIGADSKVESGAQEKGSSSNVSRNVPKGGVLNIVGSPDEVESIKAFVSATESALLESGRKDAENVLLAKQEALVLRRGELQQISNLSTEVYRVRYASPTDLMDILGRLAPTLSVQLGPSPGFNSGSTGASAAYASGPVSGLAGAGAGGTSAGASSGGSGTANPTGAKSSGAQPNALLLSGATADIVRAREILAQIDIRVPQIQFEARVEDINRDDRRQLGLRYDFSRGVQIGEQNNQKDGVVGGVGAPVNDPATVARDLTFGSILRTPYSITANLDALEKDNHAKTLASPNLSALDGQPAVVFIGDQIKYVINIQQTTQGQNIQTETATVGVTLKVTGKSSPDGTVTLYVHPEVSSVTSYQNLSNGIALPQIGTRFVDTTIRVKDGETIAIGGLIQESDVKNIQKIPILGDIPFFGQLLFRNSDTRKSRSEVIIFITTRILKD